MHPARGVHQQRQRQDRDDGHAHSQDGRRPRNARPQRRASLRSGSHQRLRRQLRPGSGAERLLEHRAVVDRPVGHALAGQRGGPRGRDELDGRHPDADHLPPGARPEILRWLAGGRQRGEAGTTAHQGESVAHVAERHLDDRHAEHHDGRLAPRPAEAPSGRRALGAHLHRRHDLLAGVDPERGQEARSAPDRSSSPSTKSAS